MIEPNRRDNHTGVARELVNGEMLGRIGMSGNRACVHSHNLDVTSPHDVNVVLDEPENEVVYAWCMTRTNIDIDEVACAAVMKRFQLATKREAVNMALRRLVSDPLELAEARNLRGSGWVGDLDDLRAGRGE